MEYLLLAKVGMFIDLIVKAGYFIAGTYVVRTGIKYVEDYRHYSQQDILEAKNEVE